MTCLGLLSRYATAALITAACLGSTTTSAFADSYDLYAIGPQHETTARGINRSGEALLYSAGGGGGFGYTPYTIYDHGKQVYGSDSEPTFFVPDNGTSCTISYQGTNYQGVCNNGYQAFGQHYINNPLEAGLYVGHDGVFTGLDLDDLLNSFVTPPDIYLNSSGDVAFLDENKDTNFQAYNTTTPEPSSYVLLLTGVGLAFVGHPRLIS